MNQKQVIAQELIAAGAVYQRDVSPDLVEIYTRALIDYAADVIQRAFAAHLIDPKRGAFFPKPADLVHQIQSWQPDNSARATLAWSGVQLQLRDSRNAKSDDPIAEAVVRQMGGWLQLGQVPADQLVWQAKDFERRYQILADHPDAAVEQLAAPRAGLRLVHQI